MVRRGWGGEVFIRYRRVLLTEWPRPQGMGAYSGESAYQSVGAYTRKYGIQFVAGHLHLKI